MNTPTHALLSVALLARGPGARGPGARGRAGAAVAGAVLPDAALFVLFAVATFVWRQAQAVTWSDTYFRPGWQHAVDALHAFPVLGAALAATYVPLGAPGPRAQAVRRWVRVAALSALLHAAADLLVHAEDAHHHLWPLSAWRFVSPVSYWDPRHHGLVFAPLECLAALALLPAAWRAVPPGARYARAVRGALGLLAAAYAVGLAAGTVRLVRGSAAGAPAPGSLQGAVTGRRSAGPSEHAQPGRPPHRRLARPRRTGIGTRLGSATSNRVFARSGARPPSGADTTGHETRPPLARSAHSRALAPGDVRHSSSRCRR